MQINKTIPKIRFYTDKNINDLPQIKKLSREEILAIKAVSQVLPFRTNNYVIEELIDWNNIPDDPIFRLTFPHPDMLSYEDFNQIVRLLEQNAPKEVIKEVANKIRRQLNPNPSGQKQYNVPVLDSEPIPGLQHKYRETVLIFPTAGQTCHAYCTYGFRWSQFVDMDDLKFATRESGRFQDYIRQHHEITDVLFTGGDPMVMKAWQLALYIEPLLGAEFEHIQTIRIGTKSLAYWPYRFVTDPPALAAL